MRYKEIRAWKKVFEKDLTYVSYELKEIVKTPAFIMLEGEMGAGKTTFSKVFLGEEETMSPTYNILYEKEDMLHADFYRIESREEVIQLELGLYLEGKNFFLAEWSKKLFHQIDPELEEQFSSYLLEIEVTDSNQESHKDARNFILYSIKK